MSGFRFSKFVKNNNQEPFDRLFDLLRELLNYTAGDLAEAMDWMNQLDREHKITDSNYGMGDFIKDLKEKGFIKENPENSIIIKTYVYGINRGNRFSQLFRIF